jgi:hypothetical protein
VHLPPAGRARRPAAFFSDRHTFTAWKFSLTVYVCAAGVFATRQVVPETDCRYCSRSCRRTSGAALHRRYSLRESCYHISIHTVAQIFRQCMLNVDVWPQLARPPATSKLTRRVRGTVALRIERNFDDAWFKTGRRGNAEGELFEHGEKCGNRIRAWRLRWPIAVVRWPPPSPCVLGCPGDAVVIPRCRAGHAIVVGGQARQRRSELIVE